MCAVNAWTLTIFPTRCYYKNKYGFFQWHKTHFGGFTKKRHTVRVRHFFSLESHSWGTELVWWLLFFQQWEKNDNVKKLQCVFVSYTVLLAKGLCTTWTRMNHGLGCYLHVFRQKKTSSIPYLQSLQETYWPTCLDRYGMKEWQEMYRARNRMCVLTIQAAAFH